MYNLNESQIQGLVGLNVAGKGGKDKEIASALGHDRAHAKFYDAKSGSTLFEYKKQSNDQWIDAFKLASLDEAPEGIIILWFNHKKGVVNSVYASTYEQVKDILFPTEHDKSLLTLYRAIYNSRSRKAADQAKCKITHSEIQQHFTLVWKRQ